MLPKSYGLTGYEPNLTDSQHMVAWAENENRFGAQADCGPISFIPP